MPKSSETNNPVATSAVPQPSDAPGAKTAAIKAVLDAYPDKMPKELAEMMRAEGWNITAQSISVVKSKLRAKPKRRAKPKAKAPVAAAPSVETPAAKPVKTADAISFDSLKKAKELAAQLGGIKEAKAAVAALSELLD